MLRKHPKLPLCEVPNCCCQSSWWISNLHPRISLYYPVEPSASVVKLLVVVIRILHYEKDSLSSKTDQISVTPMKRLDQGHLHPKLEVPRLTHLGRESKPGL